LREDERRLDLNDSFCESLRARQIEMAL